MAKIAKNTNLVGKHTGRPKGAANKTTASVKQAIEMVAKELGGAERMAAWCKEDDANERIFWGSIYPRLLPLQVGGDPENPILHRVINVVAGRS